MINSLCRMMRPVIAGQRAIAQSNNKSYPRYQFGTLAVSALVLAALQPSNVLAGGFSRNGEDVDLLFTPGNVVEGSLTFTDPSREFKHVTGTNRAGQVVTSGTTSTDPAVARTNHKVSAKFELNPQTDCMLAYREPYGFETNYGSDWVGRFKYTEFNIDTESYRAACSYKIPAGNGSVRVIGGAGYMTGDAIRRSIADTGVNVALDFGDSNDATTWQAGVAYEIPKIAAQVSAMYNAKTDLKLQGQQIVTHPVTGDDIVPRKNIYGTLNWPQSVEIKGQSGIRPGWLATASIKWQDWSELYSVPIYNEDGSPHSTFVPAFKDTLTVSGGVGTKISDKLSVRGAVTWDEGASTGKNSLTDTWIVSGGGRYAMTKNISLNLGLAAIFQSSGHARSEESTATNPVPVIEYDFGRDTQLAVQTGLQVSF